jgi:hypothetical protein
MNKYCNVIDSVNIYTEGVFRPHKHFNVFGLTLNASLLVTISSSKSVSKVIFTVLLILNRKKTANGVFFKIVELTKQLPYKTKK